MAHTVYLRNLDIAPRKARIVADAVRGMAVNEAEANLLLQRKRAADPILKLLRSAKAGASAKDLNPDTLYVQSIRVDQAQMLKRFMPRARGSASAIQKRRSHVMIVLAENPHAKTPRFTIAVQKKAKAKPDEGKSRRRKTAPDENERAEGSQASPKQSGFFKRTFGRKSGFAK